MVAIIKISIVAVHAWVGGVLCCFDSATYFSEGRTDLPREALGPYKYLGCNFPGGGGGGCQDPMFPPLDPPMD